MTAATAETARDGALDRATWIREHEVSWELVPHYDMRHGSKLPVAVDLRVSAAPSRLCDGDPACIECVRLYQRLVEIAKSVLPDDAHYEIEPFDASFHLERDSGWTPRLAIAIEILPGKETFDPPDAGVARCVTAMRASLERAGVPERTRGGFEAARPRW